MQVKIYSKKNCSFCVQAKNLLQQISIDYKEIDVEDNPAAREELLDTWPHVKSVPQIVIRDQILLGGFNELSRYVDEVRADPKADIYEIFEQVDYTTMEEPETFIKIQRKEFVELLRNQAFTVTFKKLDGTKRVMQISLQDEYCTAKPEWADTATNEASITTLPDVIVWSILDKGWRTVQVDRIFTMEPVS